jgi:Right handed beta helix region
MKLQIFVSLVATVAAMSLVAFGCQQADTSAAITLKPGSDVAHIVANAPEGTTFYFDSGVYRTQEITPKDNQIFVGKGTGDSGATILSGARLLTDWQQVGLFWVAEGLPEALHRSGYCDEGRVCTPREDLFVDGKRLERAPDLRSAARGKWFSADGKAYISIDPTGHTVELGLTPYAFVGAAKNVTIKDLVVEKFASEAQHGAIAGTDGENWRVINIVARWNHGGGLKLGKKMLVSGGSYSYNGQIGLVGEGDGAVIENLEIAHNNIAGYDWGWEAGGTKFLYSDGLTIRNTCVHDNKGPGLWTDVDNINVVIENNRVFNNDGDGIKHEISYKALIKKNFVAGNGKGKDDWLWGSQILVQNSRDVTVVENVVEVPATFGNGISVVHQKRGTGAHGPWVSFNTIVSDNTIIYLGDRGLTGMAADYDREVFERDGHNVFDRNTYVVRMKDQAFFQDSDGNRLTAKMLAEYRHEPHGKIVVERRTGSPLKCDT